VDRARPVRLIALAIIPVAKGVALVKGLVAVDRRVVLVVLALAVLALIAVMLGAAGGDARNLGATAIEYGLVV
jgi:hypothetical protein